MFCLSRTSCKKGLLTLGFTLLGTNLASASFLDTDFWCRTYGCAVVHDGSNFDIYDNWQFSSNSCCVPIGGQMIAFSSRVGTTIVTGSTNQITGLAPNNDESFLLGVYSPSDGSGQIRDDGNGYLDAADSFSAFTLNSATDIRLADSGRQYSHSFFITSRNTRFSLRALAQINNVTGDFGDTIGLGDIKLTPSFETNGNDDGFQFGRRSNAGNITIVSGVDDLGDLSNLPTQIMNFGRFQGIRQRNGDINDQTIRLDFLYTMPDYDLSMGVGSLDIDVIFDFFREP